MSAKTDDRERRIKKLIGLALVAELRSGKPRKLLGAMLDKVTTLEQDRRALNLAPLPKSAWKDLDMKTQLRKARLEMAILNLAKPAKRGSGVLREDNIYKPGSARRR